MAEEEVTAEQIAALRKKRQFKKFTFRGLELPQLMDLSNEELLSYVHARARRRMKRGLKVRPSLKQPLSLSLFLSCTPLKLSLLKSLLAVQADGPDEEAAQGQGGLRAPRQAQGHQGACSTPPPHTL